MNATEENGSASPRITYKKQVSRSNRKGRGSQPRPPTQPGIEEMCSSSGPLKIDEVNSLGHFIRIINVSTDQDIDVSGFLLLQLEGAQVVSVYRFPYNVILEPLQHITIWASGAKVSHNPPTDLVWRGRVYFRSNPPCITVLSRPNGQPVAFYKSEELTLRPDSSRPIQCKHQKAIRRPVMDQNKVYSTPPLTTTLTRTCCTAEVRIPHNTLPYSTYNRPKLYSAFRISGLAHRGPHPVSVTWHPQRLDADSPLIRLMVQKTARSKHGFNFLSHIPFTLDLQKV
ncbi:lamin tail domain-containing protein 2-like isoform X1 [Engystomops pustulosus]|uniref:lamin tail domain-containing protein 2-like isoform X1 n=1 Tax=Engystomops pustulosus TaxID=76066 RepID=UPI003AFB10CF